MPTSLVLDSEPDAPNKSNYDFTLYAADGTRKIGTISGSLEPSTKVFTIEGDNTDSVLGEIVNEVKLRINNLWFLALLPYHRYQIPKRPGYNAWDHLR
ncbi:hypothetical protein ABLO26_02275 [Neobacillus sp. 179-J 1A1 HS]